MIYDAWNGDLQWTVRPFVRLDGHDGRRTHVDLREASALYFADGWSLFAGVGKVFWGKTEACHLVDIVNQTDAVEDIDAEDKLGHLMVNVTLERSWGALDLFYLPYFRERTRAGADGRLRGPLPVGQDARYGSDAGRWHPDVAVRWSSFMGSVDLGVSAFRGTSREPRFAPAGTARAPELVATYDIIEQLSVDAQWTRGATLWKLEALVRSGQGDTFAAMVGGVEHTFFGIAGGDVDLGALVEVMLDGRDDAAPVTAFDNDIFLGARLALNDEADASLVGGPVVDLDTGEVVAFVEADRRLTGRLTISLEARWFDRVVRTSPLAGIRRDGFATVRLARHF